MNSWNGVDWSPPNTPPNWGGGGGGLPVNNPTFTGIMHGPEYEGVAGNIAIGIDGPSSGNGQIGPPAGGNAFWNGVQIGLVTPNLAFTLNESPVPPEINVDGAPIVTSFFDGIVANDLRFGDVDDCKFLKIQPGEANSVPWNQFVKSFPNGFGEPLNQVFAQGWNVNSGSGQVDNTRPSIWDHYEAYYKPGADVYSERHFSYIPAGGVERRFISFLGINAGNTQLMLDAHTITIAEDAGTGSALLQIVGGVGGGIELASEDGLKQIRVNDTNVELRGPISQISDGNIDAPGLSWFLGASATQIAIGGYLSGAHAYALLTAGIARLASPGSAAYVQLGPGNIIEFVTSGADRAWISDTAFYPETDGGVDLGKNGQAFGTAFVKGIRNKNAARQTATVGAIGGAAALPALPLGYLTIELTDGSSVKVPYYNP